MCIAIIKPSGYMIPSKDDLRTCWDNNPDGAGFAWNNGKNVHIEKGFLKFKHFYKKLMEIDARHNLTSCDVILHFRIATHGGINKECTHPFPICDDFNKMKQLSTVCNYAMAHNGIIAGYGDYKADGISDTMDYLKSVISKIKYIEEQQALINALSLENSSRLAILYKDGYIAGGNWINHNGLYYSNSSYKKYVPIKATNNYYSSTYSDYFTFTDYCDSCGQLKPLTLFGGDTWLCSKCKCELKKEYGGYKKC